MLRVLLVACLLPPLQDGEQLFRSAGSKLDKGDYRGAIEGYSRVLSADPNRADAYVGRGRAYLGLKSLVDALDDFTRATDADPKHAEGWVWHGRVQQARGEYDRALKDYAKGLDLGLRTGAVLVWRAETLFQLERFEEAEAACADAFALGERSADFYTIRGLVRYRRSNLRGSISDLTRAIQIDPDHQSVHWNRGMAYFGEQSWENALRDLRRDAELDPSSSRSMSALWIFLCRSRMGEREAALAEARAFLKESSAPDSGLSRHALSFLVDELPEAQFLNLAEAMGVNAAPARRRMIQYFRGQKAWLSGRPDEARERFRLATERPGSSPELAGIWARAELSFESRKEKKALVEDLEAKLRSLPACEMIFDLQLARKAGDEDFRSVTFSVDMRREEALLVIDGWNTKAAREFTVFFHLKDAIVHSWSVGRDDQTYTRMDLAVVKDLYRFGGQVRRLIPGDSVSKRVASAACLKIGFVLAGKPSKDGSGNLQYTLGLGGTPSTWLPEILDAEDAVMTLEGDTVSFGLPAARKKIFVDRATGMLRSLEAADYDGVTHSLKMRSSRALDRFPDVPVRPATLKAAPVGRDQVLNQMSQQESWLWGEISETFENWQRIVKAGKEKEAVAILTRWGARYADGLYAYVVRSLAGKRIKLALDLGTPPAELRRNAAQEAAKLAELSPEERTSATGYIRDRIDQMVYRLETDLFEDLVDSRLHKTIREILRRSFDYSEVDRVRRETFGDRLEELYREELDARSQF